MKVVGFWKCHLQSQIKKKKKEKEKPISHIPQVKKKIKREQAFEASSFFIVVSV